MPDRGLESAAFLQHARGSFEKRQFLLAGRLHSRHVLHEDHTGTKFESRSDHVLEQEVSIIPTESVARVRHLGPESRVREALTWRRPGQVRQCGRGRAASSAHQVAVSGCRDRESVQQEPRDDSVRKSAGPSGRYRARDRTRKPARPRPSESPPAPEKKSTAVGS